MVDLTQALGVAQSAGVQSTAREHQESRADCCTFPITPHISWYVWTLSFPKCNLKQGKYCSLVSSMPVTHDTLYSKGIPSDSLYVAWVYIRIEAIVTSS